MSGASALGCGLLLAPWGWPVVVSPVALHKKSEREKEGGEGGRGRGEVECGGREK